MNLPAKKKYFINAKCTSCKICVPLCPTGSILYGFHHFVIDRDTCSGCRVCVGVCPEGAVYSTSETISEAIMKPNEKKPVRPTLKK